MTTHCWNRSLIVVVTFLDNLKQISRTDPVPSSKFYTWYSSSFRLHLRQVSPPAIQLSMKKSASTSVLDNTCTPRWIMSKPRQGNEDNITSECQVIHFIGWLLNLIFLTTASFLPRPVPGAYDLHWQSSAVHCVWSDGWYYLQMTLTLFSPA